ncbi:Uncharacterised protein [Lysinibacillus capsici]|uniref:Uncharacterized protein n=1 Tax=Lysinibacillus capsici TaxID=2115968 RepID=A0A2X0ZAB0_9BACI|nr:hypothetical protein [Lysinibacillus capsici]SPT99491.1 Uncharacterised protein [Lysinibacillus capsici]
MIKLSRPNITKEAMQEVCKVLESGMLVQGEKVLEFETELKNILMLIMYLLFQVEQLPYIWH